MARRGDKTKICGRCMHYVRVTVDDGECHLDPHYSYIHCKATCEEFKNKFKNKSLDKDKSI